MTKLVSLKLAYFNVIIEAPITGKQAVELKKNGSENFKDHLNRGECADCRDGSHRQTQRVFTHVWLLNCNSDGNLLVAVFVHLGLRRSTLLIRGSKNLKLTGTLMKGKSEKSDSQFVSSFTEVAKRRRNTKDNIK